MRRESPQANMVSAECVGVYSQILSTKKKEKKNCSAWQLAVGLNLRKRVVTASLEAKRMHTDIVALNKTRKFDRPARLEVHDITRIIKTERLVRSAYMTPKEPKRTSYDKESTRT